MKKLLLLLFLFPVILPAQAVKGDQTLSVIGWYWMSRVNPSTTTWGATGFVYQFYFSDHFSLGGGVDIGFLRSGVPGAEINQRQFHLYPEARYHFLSGKFRPYAYAQTAFGLYRNFPQEGYNRGPFRTDVGAGLSYSISPRVALEARVGVNTFWQSRSHNSDLSYRVGIQFRFPAGSEEEVPAE